MKTMLIDINLGSKDAIENGGNYTFEPALGLLYIYETLKLNGFETFVHQLSTTDKDAVSNFRQDLIKENVNIIGLSCNSCNLSACLDVAQLAKQVNKEIVVIFGGVHPTLFPIETLKNECVDYVIIGEGEMPIINLYKYIESGKSMIEDIRGIAGCEFNNIDFSNRSIVKDLDTLPLLTYEGIDVEKYISFNRKNVGLGGH